MILNTFFTETGNRVFYGNSEKQAEYSEYNQKNRPEILKDAIYLFFLLRIIIPVILHYPCKGIEIVLIHYLSLMTWIGIQK